MPAGCYLDPDRRRAYNAAWLREKRLDPETRARNNEAARLRMRVVYAEKVQARAAEARATSMRSSAAHRVAACQLRLHVLAPDGDLSAMRERLAAECSRWIPQPN